MVVSVVNTNIFLAHLAKGHVSFCHHSASVVVCCRKLFQKSSPRKPLNGFASNLVAMIYGVLATKIPHFKLICQKTWPPLLKIEHNPKNAVFAYFSVIVGCKDL